MSTSSTTSGPSVTPLPSFEQETVFNPVAMVLGWVLPGAGHAYLGEKRRGILIGVGILAMFFGGILIGGIDVVDKKEDRIWFFGQALVGPVAFGVDAYHQGSIKVRDAQSGQVHLRSAHPYEIRHPQTGQPIMVRDPQTNAPIEFPDPRTGQVRLATDADRPPNTKSLGRVNELGMLMATLAGMLNLICVIDAATRPRAARGRRA